MPGFTAQGVFSAWGLSNGQFAPTSLGAYLVSWGVDWIAVQDTQANRDALGPAGLAILRAAGLSAGIWAVPAQQVSSAADSVAFWGADFYIANDEGPSDVPGGPAAFTAAFRAVYPALPAAVVTNLWFDAAYAAPYVAAGFDCLPEAYQNENPAATPTAVAFDATTRGFAAGYPVIGVWGGYPANDYITSLLALGGVGFSIYLAEGALDSDYQSLQAAGLFSGSGSTGGGGGSGGYGGGGGSGGGSFGDFPSGSGTITLVDPVSPPSAEVGVCAILTGVVISYPLKLSQYSSQAYTFQVGAVDDAVPDAGFECYVGNEWQGNHNLSVPSQQVSKEGDSFVYHGAFALFAPLRAPLRPGTTITIQGDANVASMANVRLHILSGVDMSDYWPMGFGGEPGPGPVYQPVLTASRPGPGGGQWQGSAAAFAGWLVSIGACGGNAFPFDWNCFFTILNNQISVPISTPAGAIWATLLLDDSGDWNFVSTAISSKSCVDTDVTGNFHDTIGLVATPGGPVDLATFWADPGIAPGFGPSGWPSERQLPRNTRFIGVKSGPGLIPCGATGPSGPTGPGGPEAPLISAEWRAAGASGAGGTGSGDGFSIGVSVRAGAAGSTGPAGSGDGVSIDAIVRSGSSGP